MNECARESCEVKYWPKTHNQKYCSSECCRVATNARMMQKYHERQRFLRGEERMCSRCQVTKLSRYNPTSVCGACQITQRDTINRDLASMFENVVA